MIQENIYCKEPYEIRENIPIFCKSNEYVENYDMIARVLLDGIEKNGANPFMDENSWREAEKDTADVCSQYINHSLDYKILDVGCGTGRMLSYFSGVKKYGIDVSFDMAKMCCEKGIESCMGDVQNMPFADESMDMIICTDVLEHVFDLYKTVSEINRVVKKGGYIVVRVPQNEDTRSYLDPSYPFQYVHLRIFSESSLALYFTKVFKLSFLEAKNTSKINAGQWIEPRFFTRKVYAAFCTVNPKLRQNKKFRSYFLSKNYKYKEIIEVFRKL